jgi:hypothetical protein
MAVTAPEWLTKRGGGLRPNYDGQSWVAYFDGQPQYLLRPVPAGGQYGCEVEQTINNRRLDVKSTFPTSDEALRGGLEELRKALGW